MKQKVERLDEREANKLDLQVFIFFFMLFIGHMKLQPWLVRLYLTNTVLHGWVSAINSKVAKITECVENWQEWREKWNFKGLACFFFSCFRNADV